MIFMTKNKI